MLVSAKHFADEGLAAIKVCVEQIKDGELDFSQELYLLSSSSYSPFRPKHHRDTLNEDEAGDFVFENVMIVMTVCWMLENNLELSFVQKYLRDQQTWDCIEILTELDAVYESLEKRYEDSTTKFNACRCVDRPRACIYCEIYKDCDEPMSC